MATDPVDELAATLAEDPEVREAGQVSNLADRWNADQDLYERGLARERMTMDYPVETSDAVAAQARLSMDYPVDVEFPDDEEVDGG